MVESKRKTYWRNKYILDMSIQKWINIAYYGAKNYGTRDCTCCQVYCDACDACPIGDCRDYYIDYVLAPFDLEQHAAEAMLSFIRERLERLTC